jgi:hypothetical protein
MQKINCPQCGKEMSFSEKKRIIGGDQMIGDECGHAITVFKYDKIISGEVKVDVKPHQAIKNQSNSQNVIITDIKMPFSSMVEFMVKWAIASIPAFIILFLIGLVVMAIFGIGAVSLFK